METAAQLVAVSLLIAAGIAGIALRSAWLCRLFADVPNSRSAHRLPVPRFGGLALWLSVCTAMTVLHQGLPPVLLAMVGPVAVSAVDDVRSVAAWIRLSFHAAAAVIAVQILGLSAVWAVPAVLAMVWMTNLFNFMDGSDGFAIVSAVCYLLGFAVLLPNGAWFSLLCAVAGGLAGILAFNLPPAKLFLGDAGSVPLGLLLGICGIAGIQDGHWSWWFPLAVVFPFFLDATWTLLSRVARGQVPWHAHREHLYQRLVARGVSPLALMLGAGAVNALNVSIAVFAQRQGGSNGLATAATALVVLSAAYFAARQWVARANDSVDN